MSDQGPSPRFDALWLYSRDQRLRDDLGQRFDVAGVARWSNPDVPELLDGNVATVGPDDPLIPDQLIQVFDRQSDEGVRRCVELYGPRDGRDALCEKYGLVLDDVSPRVLYVWTSRPAATGPKDDNRAAPPVELIDRREWVQAVTRLEGPNPRLRARAMAEAVSSRTAFYGVRIGDSVVAAAARFDDGDGAARLISAFTDPDFRRTGFAGACAARALADAPVSIGYMVAAESNPAVAALARRFGAEVAAVDLARRWVSPPPD